MNMTVEQEIRHVRAALAEQEAERKAARDRAFAESNTQWRARPDDQRFASKADFLAAMARNSH